MSKYYNAIYVLDGLKEYDFCMMREKLSDCPSIIFRHFISYFFATNIVKCYL